MDRETFEQVVEEAWEGLPSEFKSKIENVEVVIEDRPSAAIQATHPHSLILGLYQGIPMNKRTHYYGGALPDKISIYMESILRVTRSREEMIDQIKRTLLHEIGHYFGITDVHLRELGY